jgi:hypothetical protein
VLACRVLGAVSLCLLLVLAGQLDVAREHGSYLSLAGGCMILIFLIALGLLFQRRWSLRARFLAESCTEHGTA